MLILDMVMTTATTIAAPIAARLLFECIEEGIGGRILRPIGAQRVIVIAPVGQGSRGGAAGRTAAIKIIAIGWASHRANPTATGRACARVVRRAGAGTKQSGTSTAPAATAAAIGDTILGQSAIQMHGIVAASGASPISAGKGAVARVGMPVAIAKRTAAE